MDDTTKIPGQDEEIKNVDPEMTDEEVSLMGTGKIEEVDLTNKMKGLSLIHI